MGCRKAGSVTGADSTFRERPVDLLSRSHEVRLAPSIAGRAAARKVTHPELVRVDAVGGTDRDHAVCIARIRDANRVVTTEDGPIAEHIVLVPDVTGSRYEKYATCPDAIALLAHRPCA